MSCRKCFKNSEDLFCERCGSFICSSGHRLLRERKYLLSPQTEQSDVLENLRLRQHKVLLSNLEYTQSRADLVDFLFEKSEQLNLKPLTRHISVYIMDFAHSSSVIPKTLFESIALASLLISSKSEEHENTPNLNDLSPSPSALKSLELEILSILNWKLHISTVLHFIEFYSSVGFILEHEVNDLRSVKLARKFAVFLTELCITQYRFAKIFPEELALCCLAAARQQIGIKSLWPEELKPLSRSSPDPGLLSEVLSYYHTNFS